VWRVVN